MKPQESEIVQILMEDIEKHRPQLCVTLARFPTTKSEYDRFIRMQSRNLKRYVSGLKPSHSSEVMCLGCNEQGLIIACALHTMDEDCMCVALCEECED